MPAVSAQPMSLIQISRARTLLAAIIVALLATSVARADEKVVRIGFQKYGTLVLLKGRGTLEPKLKALGYRVTWSEFPSGPPLLEALNSGAIDFGTTGETPPVFAQAASDALTYVAHEPPAPRSEAILVPKDSPIQSVAELKGKKIAFTKGSNANYLVVSALKKAGLSLTDITQVHLAPSDGRAAFERGAVDAWAVWDPFFAAAEVAGNVRVLSDGAGLVPNHQFYLASRDFTTKNGAAVDVLVSAIAEVDSWAKENTDVAAKEIAPSIGIPAPVLSVALKRQSYGVRALDENVIAQQQTIADTFHDLGLVPKAVKVSDAVRKSGS